MRAHGRPTTTKETLPALVVDSPHQIKKKSMNCFLFKFVWTTYEERIIKWETTESHVKALWVDHVSLTWKKFVARLSWVSFFFLWNFWRYSLGQDSHSSIMCQHKRSENFRTHSHVLVESTNILFHVGLCRQPVFCYLILCLLKGQITEFKFVLPSSFISILNFRKSVLNFGTRWKYSMLCVSRGILTCSFESHEACDLLLGNTRVKLLSSTLYQDLHNYDEQC